MTLQSGILIAIAVMMIGGTVYYFNEEYPERVAVTRLGLAVTALGFVLLAGSIILLRP